MNVLAIVGSRFFRQLLLRHLSFLSQPPHFVDSIAEAKKTLSKPVELICLERYLPDGYGLDIAHYLHEHALQSNVPILLLASEIDDKLRAESNAAGISQVFSKYELERLASYVEKRLQHKNRQPNLFGRALLIEDSMPVSRLIKNALEKTGLQVDCFASGEEAIPALDKNEYQVALIDVLLAGDMTGVDLVRVMRKHKFPQNRRIPILAMSAVEDSARRIELLRQGANDFLPKPMLEEELIARVHNMVKLKRLLDETESQRDHLRQLAMTDQLTGLYNRHYLAEVSNQKFAAARDSGTTLSLLVVDIDYFKRINDSHGHDIGDAVLSDVAVQIRTQCPDNCVAARTGGEEFVVLMEGIQRQDAIHFAEGLRMQIEESYPSGIPVTVSMGLSIFSAEKHKTYQVLFSAADRALYQAKENGRNQLILADELS